MAGLGEDERDCYGVQRSLVALCKHDYFTPNASVYFSNFKVNFHLNYNFSDAFLLCGRWLFYERRCVCLFVCLCVCLHMKRRVCLNTILHPLTPTSSVK